MQRAVGKLHPALATIAVCIGAPVGCPTASLEVSCTMRGNLQHPPAPPIDSLRLDSRQLARRRPPQLGLEKVVGLARL
eukprot:8531183-Alexandrium_andersonii.AAC.1